MTIIFVAGTIGTICGIDRNSSALGMQNVCPVDVIRSCGKNDATKQRVSKPFLFSLVTMEELAEID
jgi:hypothetical protein